MKRHFIVLAVLLGMTYVGFRMLSDWMVREIVPAHRDWMVEDR